MSCRVFQVSFAFVVKTIFVAALCVACLTVADAAQSSTAPTSSAANSHPVKNRTGESSLDAGSVSSGVYRNQALGFACKIPAGWVLRTQDMNSEDMNSDNREDGKEDSGTQAAGAGVGKDGRVLLAAFSRPPEARAQDVNASILIAAESVDKYPGLKEAAQYFGPVTEAAKGQGFEVTEEPYEFESGAKTLARGDYEKELGTRVIRQSTLVMLARGYAVSFTFIGGTEDEVEELVQGLSFGSAAKTTR